MFNKFSFRKYGNGSSVYEVFIANSYDQATNITRYDVLGFVEKIDGEWITNSYGGLTAKTRKALIEKMEEAYRAKKEAEAIELKKDINSVTVDKVENIKSKEVKTLNTLKCIEEFKNSLDKNENNIDWVIRTCEGIISKEVFETRKEWTSLLENGKLTAFKDKNYTLSILSEMEELRKRDNSNNDVDWIIRVCQGFIAENVFENRSEWYKLIKES